jgi:hypothetical protein
VWTAAIACCSIATFAQEIAPPSGPATKGPALPVSDWNGSFQHTVALKVPSFRGLQPTLTLTYSASGGIRSLSNSSAPTGVGWDLAGISIIERISGTPAPVAGQDKAASRKGSPAYGATGFPTDSYLLDGLELVPCTQLQVQTSSPSCLVGGTSATLIGYAGRQENYLRVRQDTSANKWEITDKLGVRSVYSSYETVPSEDTFRWHLTSVIDKRGNHVDFIACLQMQSISMSVRPQLLL